MSSGSPARSLDRGSPSPPPGGTGAVILAAGRASRMGHPKVVLQAGGRTLLEWVTAAALEAGCRPVVVVVGHGAGAVRARVPLPPGCRYADNPYYGTGKGSSLAVGLSTLTEAEPGTEACVILLGDQPLVGALHIRRVAEAFRQGRKRGMVAARAVWQGVPGHPVLVHRTLFPELQQSADSGGPRAVLARHAGRVLEVPFQDDAVALDVDRWEDYVALCRRMGSEPQSPPPPAPSP